MCTLANREDPDEMPHTEAFYQGQHCLQFNDKMDLQKRKKMRNYYQCPLNIIRFSKKEKITICNRHFCYKMSLVARKTVFGGLRTTKAQTSLLICAV